MKQLILCCFLLPLIVQAHPGIGIVKDSRGNIFYTDLQQVWLISNGVKSLAVPDVHTHELYMDKEDNLHGEGGYFDAQANKFYHYQWVRRPDGHIDTVTGMREQYIFQDFSLARDKEGNEFYLKQFLRPRSDTTHLYRKSPDGREEIHASGNFKNVNWLHVQDDGTLLYVSGNSLYRIDKAGRIQLIKAGIANTKPSYPFSQNNITVWGVWQDEKNNVYAAVFSDQAVRKIDANGNMTEVYRSKGKWTPLHGVFDNKNRLWVLEGSDKNEVRVVLVNNNNSIQPKQQTSWLPFGILGLVLIFAIAIYRKFRTKPLST